MKQILAGLVVASFVLAAVSSLGVANAAGHGSVYTIDNAASNSVLQFQASPDGALTLTGTFSTHGSGTGAGLGSQGALALTDNGHWLVTVDAGSNEMTVFQVNGDGSLAFASKTGSHGTTPISVTIHDKMVYVLNAGTAAVAGNIAGFTLGSGQLTFIAGSSQPLGGAAGSSPEQIGFDNGGNVLVVAEKAANLIDTYTVGEDGAARGPTTIASNAAGPYGFAFTSHDYLVLSEAAAGTLSSYAVSDDGSLRTLSGAIPDFGAAPCWVIASHDGKFAYTSNAHGGTISGYAVAESGTMSLFSSVAAKTSVPTLDLAFSGNNHLLYALNGGKITTFQVYPDGSLAQVHAIGGLPASATGLAAS
jgi:6-phosphogluconolactonase (cycloisomerase 2 family)